MPKTNPVVTKSGTCGHHNCHGKATAFQICDSIPTAHWCCPNKAKHKPKPKPVLTPPKKTKKPSSGTGKTSTEGTSSVTAPPHNVGTNNSVNYRHKTPPAPLMQLSDKLQVPNTTKTRTTKTR